MFHSETSASFTVWPIQKSNGPCTKQLLTNDYASCGSTVLCDIECRKTDFCHCLKWSQTTWNIMKSSVSLQTLVFVSPNIVIRLFLYGSNSMHQQAKQSHGPPQGLSSYWVHRLLTHVQKMHYCYSQVAFFKSVSQSWQIDASLCHSLYT